MLYELARWLQQLESLFGLFNYQTFRAILAALTALFLFVVFSILFYALKVGVAAWGNKERTDKEAPFQAIPDA